MKGKERGSNNTMSSEGKKWFLTLLNDKTLLDKVLCLNDRPPGLLTNSTSSILVTKWTFKQTHDSRKCEISKGD
ncbi:hypothetical protein E2C01_101993 [Portunus trituberculatus]|uniref:Uncharacterized protein n=1 Tax=Portunus trituberculatus TaxID=210409 RepID=A0A5B7KLQ2_PORTR|nr:hypothetical protein [Portunus trituberculatus]